MWVLVGGFVFDVLKETANRIVLSMGTVLKMYRNSKTVNLTPKKVFF